MGVCVGGMGSVWFLSPTPLLSFSLALRKRPDKLLPLE